MANTPFRFHKIWVHEGGIATPLVAHWPAGIKARGTITHQIGHVIDVLPTVIEAAGAVYPDSHQGEPTTPLPGKSLMPVFRGRPADPHEFLFWEHTGNRAIRQGDWKLVGEHGGPWELYNLGEDRSEVADLSREHPQEAKRLATLWAEYAERIGVVDWDTLSRYRGKPGRYYRKK